jgi:hypothetical protein
MGLSPRWLRERLTWEDAVRPANEPLSVVVPGAYGYPDGYMRERTMPQQPREARVMTNQKKKHVSTIYRVWYGNDGYTPDEDFYSEDAAVQAIANHFGWDFDEVVVSDTYTANHPEFEDEYVDRASVYEDEAAEKRDARGPRAPTITYLEDDEDETEDEDEEDSEEEYE